jgi:hypothetical protein
MNRANIWSLADARDATALRKAVAAAPTAMNVCGWSYASGARCGLVLNSAGQWSIAAGPHAVASRVLHIAALRGDEACARVLWEAGVDTRAEVLGHTADAVADACGHFAVADIIRSWQRRQANKGAALEEDEATERVVVEDAERAEFDHLRELAAQGIVTLDVVYRAGSGATHHAIVVPRYASSRTVQAKIEEAIGQRVIVSFTATKKELSDVNHSAVIRLAGYAPMKCLDESSDSDDPDRAPGATRTLALKPRTVVILLHLRDPRCIARPLAALPRSDTPTLGASTVATSPSLVQRMKDLDASCASRPDYVVSLRDMVLQEERAWHNQSIANTRGERALPPPRCISPEETAGLVGRLYENASHAIRTRHDEHVRYLDEGNALLWRRKRLGEPSEEQQASIDRLYVGGRDKHNATMAAAEERLEARVVRPKPNARSPDEVAETSTRLYSSAKGKSASIAKLSSTIYGDDEPARLDKEAFDRLIDSVYTTAVSRKAAARAKIAASGKDFREIANKKKLSEDELKAMADRLSTRPAK